VSEPAALGLTGKLSHARIWSLTWPVIFANITTPLVGIADVWVMGRMPDPAYIGAVAVGAAIFTALYWLFIFLRMGTTGLVSQAYGALGADDAGAADEVVAIASRAMLIAVALAAIILLLQWPLGLGMFSLFQASEGVESLAESYFALRIYGVPGFLIHLVNLGVLFGLQEMRATMYLNLGLSTTNLLLDVFFVLGLGLGVEGVALGTVLAEWGAAAFGLYLVGRALARMGWWRRRPANVTDRQALVRLFDISSNLILRTFFVNLPFFVNSLVAASMGDVLLAVNAVLMQLFFIAIYGIDGFAHTAETLTGYAYGAGRAPELRRATVLSMFWGFVVAAAMALTYLLFGQAFVDGLTTASAVREAASDFLIWVVMIPFACVGAFLFDGVFIGTTYIREMRNAMAASALVWGIVLYVCLPIWHYHAVWIAMIAFMATRSLLLWGYYGRIEAGASAAAS
jgi:MATE family multidrug resistance protein